MDERRYYDPRHTLPPPPPPSSGGSSIQRSANGVINGNHSHEDSPYRDHPAYHRASGVVSSGNSVGLRSWEDERAAAAAAPPPLPSLSGSHHSSSSLRHSRPPPPHHYDYERRPMAYEEELALEEERDRRYQASRVHHSFREKFDDQERYADDRNWRAPVQPSYRREYYSPEVERERYQQHHQQHHPASIMIDDQRDSAPPKAAMSISSLLDSGRAVSPAVSAAAAAASPRLDRERIRQRYASPQYNQDYQRSSRMYSTSPPQSVSSEQKRLGASISDLLDDGDARRPTALNAKDLLATPDARFSLSHLASPEPNHAAMARDNNEGRFLDERHFNDISAEEDVMITKEVLPRAKVVRNGGRKLKSTSRKTVPRKSRKKVEEDWDSDLSADENRPIWTAELDTYTEAMRDRMNCIEVAFEGSLLDRHKEIGKRLSLAYRMRYEPIISRVKSREDQERKQRESRQKQRKEASRKQKEREVEMELLDTLDDGGYSRNKAKARPRVYHRGSKVGAEAEDESRAKKRKLGDDANLERLLLDEDESVMESRATSPDTSDDDDMPLALIAGLNSTVSQEKREQQLIEVHRRIWVGLARKDIPKVYKTVQSSITNKAMYWRRVSSVVAREAKRGQARSNKSSKDVQVRARKVMREMLVFWKRNEKEERDLRKKAEKEAIEKAKKEEEMREAKRQARKLNFLITQTELYSHFVGNKLKTNEAEESEETSGGSKLIEAKPAADADPTIAPVVDHAMELSEAEAKMAELKDLDFDDDDEANLKAHARRNAEEAVAAAKARAVAFDSRAAEERQKLEEQKRLEEQQEGEINEGGRRIEEKDLGKAFDQDDLNFLNPTSMGAMDLKQPKMLTCQLKEYQLKGLNWLANLYEQGINGILADEMGLGKTVQSIALMAYLAEVHDIWGPFLVIAPASTLHNWQQEISRFVPSLKALPYWGNVKDRTVLRKFWNRKQISYHRDAPFHVLITSYQLVVSDEKYFQRVKWQYMVLDEAQAIKSSSSNRWKTLLGFDCRNRLLLTGTPVQNSMQELWALLHFIMPSLFDSHDEFSEWFSKDIESHAENKGTLNEHQLRRLHMILKPFMLRRIKKNVQNELGDKIEIDLYCEMSARQRALYKSLRSRVSVTELMDKAQNLGDEAGLKSLMNLVMQFRKVCNHPELFERADVEAPFAFANSAKSGSLMREGDFLSCYDSTTSLIEYSIPKLLCREGMINIPGEKSRNGFDTNYLGNLFNIWRCGHIHSSLQNPRSTFAFTSMLGLQAMDLEQAMHGSGAEQVMKHMAAEAKKSSQGTLRHDADFAISTLTPMGDAVKALPSNSGTSPSFLTPLDQIAEAYCAQSFLAKRNARSLTTPVVAPPISIVASDGPFTQAQQRKSRDESASKILYGLAPSERESEVALEGIQRQLVELPPNGLLYQSAEDQMPRSEMQVPQMEKLIIDSSKLNKLDELLRTLKAEGHRVLIYFQMTRMIDLIEEYLIYRQYKYLRLDGSSKISDRRDMVTDWQTKPDLFVFLLSTRAGGLGINLTAADTVIFYDHDWNPSNDSQAMDRAHRLGQTKQVTVYRLITKNTIDERIVQLARNKKEVQDIVVGNKAYTDTGMAKPQEIVNLLLDDDQLAESILKKKQKEEQDLIDGKASAARSSHAKRKLAKAEAAAATNSPAGNNKIAEWSLDDDEDDFFGAKPVKVVIPEKTSKVEASGSRSDNKRASPTKRGRKPSKTIKLGEGIEEAPIGKKKPRVSKSQSRKNKPATEASITIIDAMDEDEAATL